MDNILKQYKFNIYNERLSNFTNSNGVWQDGTTPVCRDKNGKLWAISGHSHSGSIAMYSGTNMSNLKQLYFIKTDFEVGKAGVAFNNIKYPKIDGKLKYNQPDNYRKKNIKFYLYNRANINSKTQYK